MELVEALRELYAEKERVLKVIAALEELQRATNGELPVPGSNRRGRKSMGYAERREVSARMKRYWATRRKPEHRG